MPDEQESWGLVMPFVVTSSQEGPYEDNAFVAGFRCGQIYAQLEADPNRHISEFSWTVETALLPQIRLIGMQFGLEVSEVTDTEYASWTRVTLRRSSQTVDDVLSGG